jgi:uncharacterized repeat protein (TIGR01451 family)
MARRLEYGMAAMLLVSALGAAPAYSAPANGSKITNSAYFESENSRYATSSTDVKYRIPSTPTIQFLQYAPLLPQAESVPVTDGAFQPGSAANQPLQPLPPPRTVGSSAAINLAVPVPLTAVKQYHQNDPVFVRVTDADMNLDDTVRDTLIVTVTVKETGDTEVIRLTETAPASGVFAGYIPSGTTTAVSYDGILQVSQGSALTATFTDPFQGTSTTAAAVLVDPFGSFFDSATGLPVNGVKVTLCDASGESPLISPFSACTKQARALGDDGFSSYPATITTGTSAQDSSGKLYTFPAGGYRFPFVDPGNYRFYLQPPAGYAAPSTATDAAIQALPGAPYTIVSGSRGEPFPLNPGPALRIDVPLDPTATDLWVTNSAGRDMAAPGEFVVFDLTVTNRSTTLTASEVKLFDSLPPGFRLRRGSVSVAGISAADPYISGDGKTIIFSVGTMAPEAQYAVRFVAEITAGAPIGTVTSLAFATGRGKAISNTAKATVKIRDDLLRTRSILMGRITTDACPSNDEEPQNGLAGVRVYLEDGTFVVSDKEGLFHFEGVKPGLHVVQLDLDSLPDGYRVEPCTENSRFAGRAFSQFVEVQGGTLWRTDFHVKGGKAAAATTTPAPPVPGDTPRQSGETLPAVALATPRMAVSLKNSIAGQTIIYAVTMEGGKTPLSAVRLSVELPEGATYLRGTSTLADGSIKDPLIEGQKLSYQLGAVPVGWEQQLFFRASADKAQARELPARAWLAFTTPKGAQGLTPPAEASVKKIIETTTTPMPDVVIRPHFPTFGAELSKADRAKLDELVRILKPLQTRSIRVIGHTDHVPIAKRSRHIYKNNIALSRARAKSVGRYLMEALNIAPEQLTLDGKGEYKPIATNRSAKGRALNRRVEVKVVAERTIETSHIRLLKEFSGSQQIEAEAEEPVSAAVAITGSGSTTGSAQASQSSGSGAAVTLPGSGATGTAAAAAQVPAPKIKGLLRPAAGQTLLDKVNAVQMRIDSALTPKLQVDGVEIPAERIGFRATEPENGTTLYSYIGVDFGEPGSHTIEVSGLDPFGNARFSAKGTVTRTGEIARIKIVETDGNIADGVTPVRIKVELFDAEGNQLHGATRLQIKNGTLKPFIKENERPTATLDDLTGGATAEVDGDGLVLFQPVTSSGSFNTVLAYNSVTVDGDIYVKPKLRDWILVGLTEGTLGYNTASGNMENLRAGDAREEFYQDGRVAFFAKGRIKGEWLLTMSYDSAKEPLDSATGLFQHIDPESYYTLYGDSSQQQYDAASSKKLYVKIERDQFYAMFGDYDTGLAVAELSRYSRRMTGGKTEYQDRYFEVSGFAAESTQVYQRDEIPGDGTSGLYRLKSWPLVLNSEKITIVTRDRFRSEIIIATQTLSRFIDYAIDYEAGTLFFKQPVMSKDEQFNPITIVAEYEALSDLSKDYTYGGRVGVKLLDKRLKIGVSHVHEGLGVRKNDLFGVDSSLMLTDTTKLRGEVAGTDSDNAGVRTRGYSYLAELSHTSKKFDGKAYVREQESGFGLGQQMGSESATRKYGLDGVYRVTENFTSSASLHRQSNMSVGSERDVAEGKVTYSTKKYSTSLGVLHAEDRLAGGSSMSSGQITMGGKLLTLNDRLTLAADRAQSVWGNANIDYPTRTTFSAEYKVNEKVTLLGAQEFTEASSNHANATRLGIRSTPWKGGTLTSSVERQLNENSSRIFGSMGLRQTWQLTDEWKIDAGLDRSQTLYKKAAYSANPAVAPASGGTEDFTAVSAGATYLVKGLTWDSRLEYRTSDSEDKWGVLSGVVKEQGNGWAWSARGQYFQSDAASGLDSKRANVRLGLVYRPPRTQWIHLNRFDVIHESQQGGGQSDLTSLRLVNNYTANYKPRRNLQISLKYGAKFVVDTISDRIYRAFTDHWGTELRYDISKKWDVGLRASLLHSWNGGQFAYSGGPATGYNMVENVWVSLGYNIWGFTDKDFSAADYTTQGPYLRFRMKFDQQTVKDAADWLNKE